MTAQTVIDSVPLLLLLGTSSETKASLQLEDQLPPSRSSTAKMSMAPSRLEMFDAGGGDQEIILGQLAIKPLGFNEIIGG